MKNTIITILGQKGTGKTTLVKQIIKNLHNYIVIDVLNEYNIPGTVIVYDVYKLRDELSKILKTSEKKMRIIYKIDNDRALEISFKLIWAFAKTFKKEFWLICEEASLYAYNNSNTFLLNFVKYGRHYNVNQIYISRNTAELSKVITSQADLIITFRQIEPRHIEVLRKYGFDDKILDKLKKFEYITAGDNLLLKKLLGKITIN